MSPEIARSQQDDTAMILMMKLWYLGRVAVHGEGKMLKDIWQIEREQTKMRGIWEAAVRCGMGRAKGEDRIMQDMRGEGCSCNLMCFTFVLVCSSHWTAHYIAFL